MRNYTNVYYQIIKLYMCIYIFKTKKKKKTKKIIRTSPIKKNCPFLPTEPVTRDSFTPQ